MAESPRIKYGVRYPISGIHECPFGLDQARMVWALAMGNGVDATLVESMDGLNWDASL